jgi:hypothetical protein
MATSFSGGRSRNTRREPPTMDKQLVNFITWGCESSAPFLSFTKSGAIGLHELLDNPTTSPIEPPGTLSQMAHETKQKQIEYWMIKQDKLLF